MRQIWTYGPFALLALALAACGSPGPEGPDGGSGGDRGNGQDGGTGPSTLSLNRLIDLGAECTNSGSLEVDGDALWVTCTGDFSGSGKIARVDLSTDAVQLIDVGSAPGSILRDGDRLYAGDLLNGQVLVAKTDGSVVHGSDDPVVLCPSDVANNVYQFIGGLTRIEGGLLATCFATSEVKRFTVTPGADDGTVRNATVSGTVTTGGGAQAVAAWSQSQAVVLDNLASTGALVQADATGLSVETGVFTTGDVPTGLAIREDRAAITNSGVNTVQVVDLSTGTTVAEVNTGDGSNPWGVAWVDDGHVVVALQLSNEVALVDLEAGTVASRLALPSGADLMPFAGMEDGARARPQGIALSGTTVYVALTNLDETTYAPAGHGLIAVLDLLP